jgi:hypothetical protein
LQKREAKLTSVFTKREEDLESERETRKRAEKEKKDLIEEAESLRNEITERHIVSNAEIGKYSITIQAYVHILHNF